MNILNTPEYKLRAYPKIHDGSKTYTIGAQYINNEDCTLADDSLMIVICPAFSSQGYTDSYLPNSTIDGCAILPVDLVASALYIGQAETGLNIQCWRVISQEATIDIVNKSYGTWESIRIDTRKFTHGLYLRNNDRIQKTGFSAAFLTPDYTTMPWHQDPSYSTGTFNELKDVFFRLNLNHTHWPWKCVCCTDLIDNDDIDYSSSSDLTDQDMALFYNVWGETDNRPDDEPIEDIDMPEEQPYDPEPEGGPEAGEGDNGTDPGPDTGVIPTYPIIPPVYPGSKPGDIPYKTTLPGKKPDSTESTEDPTEITDWESPYLPNGETNPVVWNPKPVDPAAVPITNTGTYDMTTLQTPEGYKFEAPLTVKTTDGYRKHEEFRYTWEHLNAKRRNKPGVPELIKDDELAFQAQKWVDYIIDNNVPQEQWISHQIPGYPGGGDPLTRFQNALGETQLGEMVSTKQTNFALDAFAAEGPGDGITINHYDIMFDPKYSHVGIAERWDPKTQKHVSITLLGTHAFEKPDHPIIPETIDVAATARNIEYRDLQLWCYVPETVYTPAINLPVDWYTYPRKESKALEQVFRYDRTPRIIADTLAGPDKIKQPNNRISTVNHKNKPPEYEQDAYDAKFPPGPNLPWSGIKRPEVHAIPGQCGKITENWPEPTGWTWNYKDDGPTLVDTFHQDDQLTRMHRLEANRNATLLMDYRYNNLVKKPTTNVWPDKASLTRNADEELYEHWVRYIYSFAVNYDVASMIDPTGNIYGSTFEFLLYEYYVYHRQSRYINLQGGKSIPSEELSFAANNGHNWNGVDAYCTKGIPFPYPADNDEGIKQQYELIKQMDPFIPSQPTRVWDETNIDQYNYNGNYPITKPIMLTPPKYVLEASGFIPVDETWEYAKHNSSAYGMSPLSMFLEGIEKYYKNNTTREWSWPTNFNLQVTTPTILNIATQVTTFTDNNTLPPEFRSKQSWSKYLNLMYYKYQTSIPFKPTIHYNSAHYPIFQTPQHLKQQPWPGSMDMNQIITFYNNQNTQEWNDYYNIPTIPGITGLSCFVINQYYPKHTKFTDPFHPELNLLGVIVANYNGYIDRMQKLMHFRIAAIINQNKIQNDVPIPPLTITTGGPVTQIQYTSDLRSGNIGGSEAINFSTNLSKQQGSPTQDPDGITWLPPERWPAATWDGIPRDVLTMTNAEIMAYAFPNANTMRGLREHFYNINPFQDIANPTIREIDNWNLETIRHFRKLFGILTPIWNDYRLYLRAQWGAERKYTTYWDAAYPNGISGPNPAEHAGADFIPSIEHQQPYLQGSTPVSLMQGAEGIFSANTNISWAIKMTRVIAQVVGAEGRTGHGGPFFGRTYVGMNWAVDETNNPGFTEVRLKWSGDLVEPTEQQLPFYTPPPLPSNPINIQQNVTSTCKYVDDPHFKPEIPSHLNNIITAPLTIGGQSAYWLLHYMKQMQQYGFFKNLNLTYNVNLPNGNINALNLYIDCYNFAYKDVPGRNSYDFFIQTLPRSIMYKQWVGSEIPLPYSDTVYIQSNIIDPRNNLFMTRWQWFGFMHWRWMVLNNIGPSETTYDGYNSITPVIASSLHVIPYGSLYSSTPFQFEFDINPISLKPILNSSNAVQWLRNDGNPPKMWSNDPNYPINFLMFMWFRKDLQFVPNWTNTTTEAQFNGGFYHTLTITSALRIGMPKHAGKPNPYWNGNIICTPYTPTQKPPGRFPAAVPIIRLAPAREDTVGIDVDGQININPETSVVFDDYEKPLYVNPLEKNLCTLESNIYYWKDTILIRLKRGQGSILPELKIKYITNREYTIKPGTRYAKYQTWNDSTTANTEHNNKFELHTTPNLLSATKYI